MPSIPHHAHRISSCQSALLDVIMNRGSSIRWPTTTAAMPAGTLGNSAGFLTPASHAHARCAGIHAAGSVSDRCKSDESSVTARIMTNARPQRMAHNAKKTEHAGPKKGRGAFYGRKAEAKRQSSQRRREDGKLAVESAREELARRAVSTQHPRGPICPCVHTSTHPARFSPCGVSRRQPASHARRKFGYTQPLSQRSKP